MMTFKMKAIINAKAFVKDGDTFENIVNMCSLKPVNDWHNWQDRDKNLLKIHKNNSIHIYPAKTHAVIKKDYKARPATIAKNSHWAMLAFGKDIFGNEASLIWFKENNKLKLSFFVEECWVENYLPLLSGIDILKLICKEQNTEFKKVKIPKILNLKVEEGYVVKWPPNKKEMEKLEKCQNSVRKVLQGCGL